MKNVYLFLILVMMSGLTNCKKDQPIPPVLTTTDPTHIGATIATSGGNILSEGSSTVLRRGVCWSLNNTPTINDDTTFNGTGAGKFESDLTGLKYNADYFVRAYAINAEGVGYGNAMSFKTLMAHVPYFINRYTAVNITATSAICSAYEPTTEIGLPILSKGVCWNVYTQLRKVPTISDNKAVGVEDPYHTGWFETKMTALTENTLYAYASYATNAVGTGYGDILVLITPPLLPTTVITGIPLFFIGDKYKGIVQFTTNSNQTIFGYGANWSTTPHPVASDDQYSVINSSIHFYYEYYLTGLIPNTLYYVRAWVIYNTPTGHNLVYGNEEWFYSNF